MKKFIIVFFVVIASINKIISIDQLIYPANKSFNEEIRVVTYNIRGDFMIDREQGNSWEIRKNKICFLMQSYNPDIIGFQEVSTNYMHDLHALFPTYNIIAFDVSEKYKDVVLMVKKNRFEVREAIYFWISDKQVDKNPHLTIKATIFDKQAQKLATVFCTHFDSGAGRGVDLRIENATRLIKELTNIDLPVIVVGDFNLIMTTDIAIKKNYDTYNILTNGTGLLDVRKCCLGFNYGPNGTWIGWRYDKFAVKNNTVGERLDHIFVKHCTVLKAGVLNLKVNDDCDKLINTTNCDFQNIEYPSDHLPVITDLLLN